MTDSYFDPAQLAALAEVLDPNAVAETADYSKSASGGSFFIEPGEYTNPSRDVLEVKQEADGTVTVVFSLTGGISLPSGKTLMTKYPERKYVSNRLRASDRGTGMTSDLAEYFKAVGVETAGRPIAELVTLLPETTSIPATVFVSLTDKTFPDPITGLYPRSSLKLRDFRAPDWTSAAPKYLRQVERDGKTFIAKPKISRFVAPS